MAQDQIDKIISIQFKSSDLVDGWVKVSKEIDINKKNLAELKNEYKAGKMSATEYNKAVLEITSTTKALTAEKKSYEKEIQSNIRIETQASGSLNQLKANISKLTAQYNALSAAEREGSVGKRMTADIKSQQEAINQANTSLGDYRSQVGSYEQAIMRTLGVNGKFSGSLSDIIKNGGGVTAILKSVASGIKGVIKSALAFIATPFGATLAVIAATILLVKRNLEAVDEQYYKSERAMDAYNAKSGQVQATTDAINRSLEAQAEKLSSIKAAWNTIKAYFKAISLLGPIKGMEAIFSAIDAADQYDAIIKKEKEFRDARRASYEKEASLQRDINEARNKAMQKETYSATERQEFIEEAIAKNRQLYDIRIDLARKEQEIYSERIKLSPSDTEALDKEAQLKARIISLDGERNMAEKMLQQQINRTSTEMLKLQKTMSKSAKDQLDIEKGTLEAILNLRQESLYKDLELTRLRFAFERKELEDKLKYDKDLSIQAQEEINRRIILLKQEQYKEESDIRKKWQDKELEEGMRNEEARILMRQKIQSEMDKLAAAQVRNQNYAGLKSGIGSEELKAKQAIADEELRQAKKNLETITQMTEDEWSVRYGSLQQYEIARLDAENRIQDAIRTTSQLAVQGEINQLNAAKNIIGGLHGLLGAMGDEFEGFAIAQQALAAVQAIIDAQKATMAAMAACAALGPIAGPVAFASQKAMISAQLGISLATILAQAIPAFAEGGLITGPGTSTSDSIPAWLSNGEAVMTARAVTDWGGVLSAINVSSGGRPINTSNLPERGDGMRGMKRMMKEALMEMPNPIVLVKDIDSGQKRVRVASRLGRLGRNSKN